MTIQGPDPHPGRPGWSWRRSLMVAEPQRHPVPRRTQRRRRRQHRPHAAARPSRPRPRPPTTDAAGTSRCAAGHLRRQRGRRRATIAIAIKDGKAIAYLCDGRSAEAWLQGTATDGELVLTGADGASAHRHLCQRHRQPAQSPPRAGQWDVRRALGSSRRRVCTGPTPTSANAQIVGGWIVLADGTQVGITRKGGVIAPAPELNPANRRAVLDGTTVPVDLVDGTDSTDPQSKERHMTADLQRTTGRTGRFGPALPSASRHQRDLGAARRSSSCRC